METTCPRCGGSGETVAYPVCPCCDGDGVIERASIAADEDPTENPMNYDYRRRSRRSVQINRMPISTSAAPE